MTTKKIPSRELETFANPNPDRDYTIRIHSPEFTCLCPKTGQPDFATITLRYIPDERCVELKSWKLYLWSWRDEGAFHEAVTNQILDDLVAATEPRWMQLVARFNVRGGIWTTVTVEYRQPDGNPDGSPDGPSSGTRVGSNPGHGLRVVEGGGSGPSGPSGGPLLHLGIDLGTSGCRITAVDAEGHVLGEGRAALPAPRRRDTEVTQDPGLWWRAVIQALERLLQNPDVPAGRVSTIAVAGTSGSALLVDGHGRPVSPGIMYDDHRAQDEARDIARHGGPECAAAMATSGLAKLLWLARRGYAKKASWFLSPADWIAGRLMDRFGASDYNNCLKLGFDARTMTWPRWLDAVEAPRALLPEVYAPGTPLGPVARGIVETFGFPEDAQILAGTTDGVAAFLAAGTPEPGQGVTSLGSTLVLKLLSDRPIFSAAYGVYSHRLGQFWIAGGASNAGGATLDRHFTRAEIESLSLRIDPDRPSGLHYYPLPGIGERFPVNDPGLQPRLEPRPENRALFLQGILEGIAKVELRGYALLAKLGGPSVSRVITTGSGAANPNWTAIRERCLKVPVEPSAHTEASYGVALLASGRLAALFDEPSIRAEKSRAP